jgi:two-component system, OmpR family, phosphate regulon response regulator PhoB
MKTILLAEDEDHLRILVRTTLEDSKYRILEACNGLEALQLARDECPDLLVLDWMMPGMTGVDVVRTLLEESGAPVPFILLTARGQEWEKSEGAALGARGYLVKPFSPLELLAKVEEVLG